MLRVGILFFIHLQKHLHPIHLKDTHIAELSDFIRIQQLHSSCTLIEVIAEGDAAVPVLDFAGASPKGEVERFGGLEEFAESGDVDIVHRDELRVKRDEISKGRARS